MVLRVQSLRLQIDATNQAKTAAEQAAPRAHGPAGDAPLGVRDHHAETERLASLGGTAGQDRTTGNVLGGGTVSLLANRGYVMDSGEITMNGVGKDMLDDPKVRAAYLGEDDA